MKEEAILKLNQQYDYTSYSPQVYMDLVVNRIDVTKRLEIMGAWKGGCLRKNASGSAYIDSNQERYSFTKRWKYDCPVSRRAWEEISLLEASLDAEIPTEFPDKEPKVMQDCKARKGIDFVLAIFILHCCKPEVYPLYDQHVFRAYMKVKYNAEDAVSVASKDWRVYRDFTKYIGELREDTNLPYWIIDRGLWVYGRNLKKRGEKSLNSHISVLPEPEFNDDTWVRMNTLGKAYGFYWKFSDSGSIFIKRDTLQGIEEVSENVINSVFNRFVNKGWFPLANSVSKTKEGTEKDGFGSFLVDKWKFNPTQQQLSSQLSTIFVNSGIWQSNGKKRGMFFKIMIPDWRKPLRDYYEKGKAFK